MNNMNRKFLIALLILSIFLSVPLTVSASDSSQNSTISEKQCESIEALYRRREQLAIDYVNNEKAINEIDQQILSLGAKTVPDEYVMSKKHMYSDTSSSVSKGAIPNNYGVKWTDYRKNVTVNGKNFETQVITGVPNKPDSPLLNHNLTYSRTPDATYKAAWRLVFGIAVVGAEHVPGVSTIATVADLAKKAYDLITVSDSVTVSGVNCSANTASTSTMRMVYVKYAGSSDSTQRLVYLGNSSSCETTFTIGYNKKNADGTYSAKTESRKKTFTIQSKGYQDFSTMCWDFHMFRTHGTDFESNNLVNYCTLKYQVKKGSTYASIKNGKIKLPLI